MKNAHDYMIALTADERTPSVKAMVDIILLDAAKAIDEARQDGHADGYEAGKDESYEEGYDDGYAQGREEA